MENAFWGEAGKTVVEVSQYVSRLLDVARVSFCNSSDDGSRILLAKINREPPLFGCLLSVTDAGPSLIYSD